MDVCAIITRDIGNSSGAGSSIGGCAIHSSREMIRNGFVLSPIVLPEIGSNYRKKWIFQYSGRCFEFIAMPRLHTRRIPVRDTVRMVSNHFHYHCKNKQSADNTSGECKIKYALFLSIFRFVIWLRVVMSDMVCAKKKKTNTNGNVHSAHIVYCSVKVSIRFENKISINLEQRNIYVRTIMMWGCRGFSVLIVIVLLEKWMRIWK